METLSIWHFGKNLKNSPLIASLILAMGIAGCASSPKSNISEAPASNAYGPSPSESPATSAAIPGSGGFVGPLPSESPPPQVFGPTQIQLRPAILVFGPGGAKAMGAAGVLKVLKQEKIPIQAIVATEISGAISALFAIDGSVNALDWKLKKIDWKEFDSSKGWKSHLPKSLQGGGREPSSFMRELKNWVSEKKLNELKIPLGISASDSKGKTRIFFEENVTTSVRAGLGRKDIIAASSLDNEDWLCSCEVDPFPIRLVQSHWNGFPIIAVDFGDTNIESQHYARDLAEAIVVVKPELSEFNANDFSKQNEIILQSEQKTKSKLREIRLAVGLPEQGKP